MRLLIVESPAKARTLQSIVGPDYLVRATKGHIRDLPKSGLGIDIARGFRPQWRTLPSAREELTALQNEAFLCSEILLATDADREGEGIAAQLADRLRKTGRPCRRVSLTELTRSSVEEAIAHPTEIDECLVEAQTTRRIIDRLIGYTVSPILTTSTEGRTVLATGRVAAATLSLVRERERQTGSRSAHPAWRVEIDWISADGRHTRTTLDEHFPDGQSASARAHGLTGLPATVASCEEPPGDRTAASGLTTYDLLIRASATYGLTAAEAARAAQRLYEGIDRADLPPLALISYPRTDETAIPPSVLNAARGYLYEQHGTPAPSVPPAPPTNRTHGCIRPLAFDVHPDAVRPLLSPAEYRVYSLVWESTLAACTAEGSHAKTPIALDLETPAGSIRVLPTGRRPCDRFEGPPSPAEEGECVEDRPEETVTSGDLLTASRVRVLPDESPDRSPFSDGSLVEAMRSTGIARPGTCAGTIQGLVERGALRRSGQTLETTRLGRHVLAVLDERFPDLAQPSFTKRIEEALDAVASGQSTRESVASAFYESWVLPALSRRDAPGSSEPIRAGATAQESIDRARCPTCGRPLVERSGRFGSFFGCTGYPRCRFTRPIG